MISTYFNLQQANELIPRLEEIFEAIAPMRRRARGLLEEIAAAEGRLRGNGGGGVGDEVERSRRQLEETVEAIQGRLEEVQSRGILIRSLDTGLVDFPTLEEGREIYLCWRSGEREVAYWHETDTGFAGRQPIDPV